MLNCCASMGLCSIPRAAGNAAAGTCVSPRNARNYVRVLNAMRRRSTMSLSPSSRQMLSALQATMACHPRTSMLRVACMTLRRYHTPTGMIASVLSLLMPLVVLAGSYGAWPWGCALSTSTATRRRPPTRPFFLPTLAKRANASLACAMHAYPPCTSSVAKTRSPLRHRHRPCTGPSNMPGKNGTYFVRAWSAMPRDFFSRGSSRGRGALVCYVGLSSPLYDSLLALTLRSDCQPICMCEKSMATGRAISCCGA